VYQFTKASVNKGPQLGDLNNRSLLFQCSEKVKVRLLELIGLEGCNERICLKTLLGL
jgi:hypothetical protein